MDRINKMIEAFSEFSPPSCPHTDCGCEGISRCCLDCPLPRCIYERTYAQSHRSPYTNVRPSKYITAARKADDVAALARSGLSQREINAVTGIPFRTIQRAFASRLRPAP